MIVSSPIECVLIEDFNEVRDESERMGSQFYLTSTRSFNQLIDQFELIVIPLGDAHFTLSDKWGKKFSKLERYLVSNGFLSLFPHLLGTVLENKIPNHRHILLLEHKVDYGPVPFRLVHYWFDMDGFDVVV